ncbi:hypothetical protein ACN261_32030 [Micromonospora sp. WMMD723]|uniref:hypothetical protein n=1 Tax=Micromonospora sp. WMMD723 TaxID=3403465 RepID=UPI003CEB88F9
MTTSYNEISPAAVVTIAGLIERQHRPAPAATSWAPGTCRQCTPAGCPQMDWAAGVLAQYWAAGRIQQ